MEVDHVVLYSTIFLLMLLVVNLIFDIIYFILTNKKILRDVHNWLTEFYQQNDVESSKKVKTLEIEHVIVSERTPLL